MRLICMLLASIISIAVSAAEPAAIAPTRETAARADTDKQAMDEYDQLVKMAVNHPNELYRLYAVKAATQGSWGDAVKHFRTAARYADKYSQHRLSLLYWHGLGVTADRVEAYVWADLAAERGYPKFLAIREKMWSELTVAQQAAVPERGATVYAEYGDPTAKKRFATALAQGKRQITGSRTGFFNRLYISTVGAGNQLFGSIGGVNLDQMYEASRTDPQKYWAFEDHVWKNVSIEISDLQQDPQQDPQQDHDSTSPADKSAPPQP